MEEFVRKKLSTLPLLILVRKTPGFSDSFADCWKRGQCQSLMQHLRAILVSWLIVVSCYFMVLPFEGYFQPVYNLVSKKTDTFLFINAGTDAGEGVRGALAPTELYEIDDATYRRWNFPAIIPRDRLDFLIRRAVDGGAAVIAVDVDLTYANSKEDDQHLGELLKSLNESADPDSPVILLTRRLLRPLDIQGQVNQGAIFSLPSSFLDQYLPEQKKVFWASTLFNVDDDHIVRRWRNAEVYCARDGHFALFPSLQLLATVAYNHKSQGGRPDLALQELTGRLSEVAGKRKCDGKEAMPSLKSFFAQFPAGSGVVHLEKDNSANVLRLADFGEAERINYRISRVTEQGTKSQIVVTSVGDLESTPSRLDVLDRLVLIGASFEESNDLHSSPVSDDLIPGIYILANAIDTMQGMRTNHDVPAMLGPMISLIMLIIGALLLERGNKKTWLGVSVATFFLIGLLVYSPGGGAAAMPFSVFFVVLWFVVLESLDKFVTRKHE